MTGIPLYAAILGVKKSKVDWISWSCRHVLQVVLKKTGIFYCFLLTKIWYIEMRSSVIRLFAEVCKKHCPHMLGDVVDSYGEGTGAPGWGDEERFFPGFSCALRHSFPFVLKGFYKVGKGKRSSSCALSVVFVKGFFTLKRGVLRGFPFVLRGCYTKLLF